MSKCERYCLVFIPGLHSAVRAASDVHLHFESSDERTLGESEICEHMQV